ncbi:MAG: 3'-5' exonuclease [Bacteroidales bacterium]|nr:3'-5' exonuclease [Bacteroidales bacterium]
MMLNQIKNTQILFLDIETVPSCADFNDLSPLMQKLWEKKANYLIKSEEETPSSIYQKAGIYAEFGKIICISAGFFTGNTFRLKSFYGNDETKILNNFNSLLNKSYNTPDKYLCAHNGKEFDYPYIARRMLINDITLPEILNLAGKKPWEIKHLDTLELWKFGDYKHYTSLELLTTIFNIPTPKDDIDGSMVAEIYYKEKDIKRIAVYCEKDVVAVAQLYLKYKNQELIKDENIISVS